MRSLGLKTLAVLLTAAALVMLVGSAFAVVYLEADNLYRRTPEDLKDDLMEDQALRVSSYVVDCYSYTSNLPAEDQELGLEIVNSSYYQAQEHIADGTALYCLKREDGTVLQSNLTGADTSGMIFYEFTCDGTIPVIVNAANETDEQFTGALPADGEEFEDTSVDPSIPSEPGNVAEETGTLLYEYDWYIDDDVYHICHFEGETYLVEIYLAQEIWSSYYSINFPVIEKMYAHRNHFIAGVIIGAVALILGFVYLGWAAGRTRGRDQAS